MQADLFLEWGFKFQASPPQSSLKGSDRLAWFAVSSEILSLRTSDIFPESSFFAIIEFSFLNSGSLNLEWTGGENSVSSGLSEGSGLWSFLEVEICFSMASFVCIRQTCSKGNWRLMAAWSYHRASPGSWTVVEPLNSLICSQAFLMEMSHFSYLWLLLLFLVWVTLWTLRVQLFLFWQWHFEFAFYLFSFWGPLCQ